LPLWLHSKAMQPCIAFRLCWNNVVVYSLPARQPACEAGWQAGRLGVASKTLLSTP